MVSAAAVAEEISKNPAFLEAILEDVHTIINAVARIHAAKAALRLPATPVVAPSTPAEPEGAKVFDTSAGALENYDAEQLVLLRKDHAAVDHPADACHICAILERRLGSAKP